MRRTRTTAAVLGAASLLMVLAAPVHAAYPGENGLIAFTGPEVQGIGPQIHVVRPNGSREHAVTGSMYVGHARWSPDGELLAVEHASSIGPRTEATPAAPLVRGRGTFLPYSLYRHDLFHAGDVSYDLGLPSWSADGSRLMASGVALPAFASVLLATTTGAPGDLRPLETGSVVVHGYRGDDPVLSPDGSRVAWSQCDGDRCGIWTMRPDDPASARLIVPGALGAPALSPDWSPDGRTLVFQVGETQAGGTQVHTVGRDAGATRRVTVGFTPAFSPDGRSLVVSAQDGLYVTDRDGGKRKRIARGTTREPDWQARPARRAR